MFGRLYKKIYIPLMVLSIVLIVFVDVFAVIVESFTLKDAYSVTAEKKLERIMNSCRLYISSAEVTVYNLSLDETVINELDSPSGISLVNKLDNACNYSLKINAACAYSSSGSVYSSSGVTQVPSLDELKQDEGIAAFLKSDDSAFVSLRTKHIARIFNNAVYPEEMGVISCCQKVYSNGQTVGLLITDILPVNLYSYVFGDGQFDDAVAFITSDGGYFEYGDNAKKSDLLTGSHSGYFAYSATADNGLYTISVFDSKSGYNSKLLGLISMLLICSALLITAVHFMARAVAKSVTNRLDFFLTRMNSAKLP